MKFIIFICFTFLYQSSFAIEFIRCINDNGKVHLTTMPKSSLDANCKQKTDHYSIMLEQDYSKLNNQFTKYEEQDDDLVIGNVNEPVLDGLDPDKALNELLENSDNNRESAASELFKKRSDAVDSILSEEKPVDPPNDT